MTSAERDPVNVANGFVADGFIPMQRSLTRRRLPGHASILFQASSVAGEAVFGKSTANLELQDAGKTADFAISKPTFRRLILVFAASTGRANHCG
jgi:hypothetical protein